MASGTCKACSWIAFLLLSPIATSACTYTIVPTAIPAVEESKEVTFAGSTAAVISAEKDDKDFLIYASARHGSFEGNRKTWCDKLVAAISAELTGRGVVAAPDSKNQVSVTLPEISGRSGYATVGFAVKTVVTTSSGFKKEYEAAGSATMGWTMGGVGERSASYVLAELVKKMLADPEFVAAVRALK